MHGKFAKKMDLPDEGDIDVSGPFTPDGDETEVMVHFLIVQGDEEDPKNADQTVTVSGYGVWTGGEEWSGTASPKGRLPSGDEGWLKAGRARGIGLAVAVKREGVTKDPPGFDPPSYQTLTWCADFELVGARKQAGVHRVEG
jgi:hypothetical protein